MSVYYSRTMTISCDRCIEAQSFTCPGEGTDWKEANENFFRLGWTLHKGKHLCPNHAAKRQTLSDAVAKARGSSEPPTPLRKY